MSATSPSLLSCTDTLQGFALLALSPHRHLDVAFAFPSLPEPLRSTLLTRALLREPSFGRLGRQWHYSFPLRAGLPAGGARAVSVVVFSHAFSPEALLTLARVLGEAFISSGCSYPALHAAWLEAFSTGVISSPAWALRSFDASRNFRASGAKALIGGLGVEVIRVWTALMLRKRVAVVGASAAEVIRAVRLLPLLVAHRFAPGPVAAGTAPVQDSPAGLMFPYVALSEYGLVRGGGAEGADDDGLSVSLEGPLGAATRSAVGAAAAAAIADLEAAGAWVAGFTDPAVLRRGGELWDVCVDLTAHAVLEADAAKVALSLGPVHKEVAKALVEALADPAASDSSILAAIAGKTQTLTGRLEAWLPGGVPLGLPAGALEHGYPGLPPRDITAAPLVGGTQGGALLLSRFSDVLSKEGLPVGTASTEAFLFALACAEPRLQTLASAGVRDALTDAASRVSAAAGSAAS